MATSTASFRVGAASTKITPGEPMWLAGFAVRTEPAKGILSDLFAKAVALEDAWGHRVVIVSADLIAISKWVAQQVAQIAHQRHGLSRDQLLLCATHTHYGPELRPDKVLFFHIPPQYAVKIQPFADHLVQILSDLISAAIEAIGPGGGIVMKASVDFAANRRESNDPVDHDVPVLYLHGQNGHAATVFGYACHNTTMPPADCLYSADWAGFAAEKIASGDPNEAALFLPGAGADQNPNSKGPEVVSRRYGADLASAVLNGATRHVVDIFGDKAHISTAFAEAQLDFQPLPSRSSLEHDLHGDDQPKRTKARFLLDALDRGVKFDSSYPCPVQVIRIGEKLLLIAIGGEPVIDYAVNLKREFGGEGKLVWVVGYANDMFGYVPTPRVLRGGGYEGTRSVLWSALPMPFTESVEERVLETVRRLATETQGTQS